MTLPESRTLARVLTHINAADSRGVSDTARRSSLVAAMILLGEKPGRASADQFAEELDRALDRPSHRLAVYGSLRPGGVNHAAVADLGERWSAGWVRGVLDVVGERTAGFPVLTPDVRAQRQAVEVLDSPALPARWEQLDQFEGAAYRRVLVVVEDDAGGLRVANLYAAAT